MAPTRRRPSTIAESSPRLCGGCRAVLVLRYYADLSIAEIAETLRIAPSAVRACNSRGLAALAHALREDNS